MVKNKQKLQRSKILYGTIAVLFVLLIGFISTTLYYAAHTAEDNPDQIRNMLVRGIEDTYKPTPTDFRTSDSYIPEMKLYIPFNDKEVQEYNYSYHSEYKDEPRTVTISSQQTMAQPLNDLYNAQDSRTVFDRLPKLQACSRAITLSDQPLTDELRGDLKQVDTVKVSDGRTIYLYQEPLCSDVSELQNSLRSLRSY